MGLAFSPLPCLSRPRRASPPFPQGKRRRHPPQRNKSLPAHSRAASLALSGGSEPRPATPAARRSLPAHPRAALPALSGGSEPLRQPPRRGGPFRPFPARPCSPLPGDRNHARQPRGATSPLPAHPRAASLALSGGSEPGPTTPAARRVPSGPFPRGLVRPFWGDRNQARQSPRRNKSLPAPSRPPHGLARPFRRIETGPGTPPPAARRLPLRPFPARPRLPFPRDRNRARQPPRRGGPFRPIPARPCPPFPGDRNRTRQPPRRGSPFRPFPQSREPRRQPSRRS